METILSANNVLSQVSIGTAMRSVGMALATFLGWKLLQAYMAFRTTPLRQLPGPRWKSFWLGHMRSMAQEPFFAPHTRWWKEAMARHPERDVPLLAYSYIFGLASVLVLDPDLVQTILLEQYRKEPLRFSKRYDVLQTLVGDGLVTLEGSDWARHRRIIQPSFATIYLKEALNASVPRRTATLIQCWKDAGPNRAIDLNTHMSALTLDVIGDVAFSHHFGGLDAVRKWAEQHSSNSELAALNDPVFRAFNKAFNITGLIFVLVVAKQVWLFKCLPQVRKLQRTLNEAVDGIIAKARHKDSPDLGPGKRSLLQLLFHATDYDHDHSTSTPTANRALSNAELRDECKTFIMAGHETTSTWCYWTLYALGLHPEMQENMYAEIHQVVGDNGKIDSSATEQMPYLWAFLQEVLRFYPPAAFVSRYTERTEHWRGYTIPADTRMVLPVLMLHRHPHYWYDDPEVFQPERWLQPSAPMKHKFCFMPFAAGPRNCVGQQFAQIEVKLIVASIVRDLMVELASSMQNVKVEFQVFATLKSKVPLEITVRPRK